MSDPRLSSPILSHPPNPSGVTSPSQAQDPIPHPPHTQTQTHAHLHLAQSMPLLYQRQPPSAAPSLLDAPGVAFRPDAPLSMLCASARTSYTRVDAPTVPGTPMRPSRDLPDDARPDGITHAIEPTLLDPCQGTGACAYEDYGGEKAEDAQQEAAPRLPQVVLTFLLVSGRRRTMAFDPATTIGRVKELAWNAWPNEWQDERPPAPSYLRILYLGKILQDDDTLSKWSFPTHTPAPPGSPAPPAATIVHLSIRASAPSGAGDSPAKKRRRRGRAGAGAGAGADGEEAGCCSGCVVC